MENLWPDSIFENLPYSDVIIDLRNFLQVQAEGITESTRGAIEASINETMYDSIFVFAFKIWPRGLPDKSYELFRLRAPQGRFPVAVENYHLPDESRAQRFSDFPSLIKGFKKIFSAELTRKIIVSLASDALKASAKVPGPPDTIAENERPIVIGQLIDDGTPYCMVNFLGVAGFVSIDTLKELAQQPDTKGSAYTKLDEKYVVALDYLGQIRMSLTESEMKKLLSNAKQVLQEY